MPFNKTKTKILVPIKKVDPDNPNNTIVSFCYVPYPHKSASTLNRRKRKLAVTYGFDDTNEFWEEISEMAYEDGYVSVWKFIEDGNLDMYYDKTEPNKKKKTTHKENITTERIPESEETEITTI
jgi:hypothetical protein